METLHRHLLTCQQREGIGHQIAINNLRAYMRRLPFEVAANEMDSIGDIALLKYMQEAGLRGPMFARYLLHLNALGSREGE